ncbi:MAG TPA: lysine 5,6-aminomutase subunit alpha, partial [Candidatus Cybelea sp.]
MELRIDRSRVDRCRELAVAIADPVEAFIAAHSTVSVERAVLRLLGVDGVSADDVPLPNVVVDSISREELGRGAALPFGRALAEAGLEPAALARALTEGRAKLDEFAATPAAAARGALRQYVDSGLARITAQREERAARLARLPQLPPPLLYIIVASGNIYEDRTAAVAAAEAGAQVIAVIRSTGQSLLDFVPFGPTTEGFGGTYATQANFAVMRAALDEVGERLGRYIMLTNYASGLCM